MKQKIHPYYFIIIIAVILLFIFIGYTYVVDVDAISKVYAEIDTINSVDFRLTSSTIIFTINITNPSNREIQDLSSTYDVYIDMTYIGKGSFSELSIKPMTSAYQKSTLVVYHQGLANATKNIIENWINYKETDLIIKGTMHASTLFGLVDISHAYIAST